MHAEIERVKPMLLERFSDSLEVLEALASAGALTTADEQT